MSSSHLHYTVVGEGQAIIFLHPVGLDGACWSRVSAALANRYRCYMVDLSGHGSSADANFESVSQYADSIHDFLTHLGLRNTSVVGLSFGGMIAQCLALNYPDDVGKLVLCGCPASFPDEVRPLVAARGKRALEGGMAAVVDETITRWFTEEYIVAGNASTVRERLLSDNPHAWAKAWSAISQLNNTARLSSLVVPTTCIAGENDIAVAPKMVEALAAGIPGARYALLSGASHMMHIENEASFIPVLEKALELK